MKKSSLLFMTLIFSACLLFFACRKDLKNFIHNQSVPTDILETAKIWSEKKFLNLPASRFINLRPNWDESWVIKKENDETILVAPTVENHIVDKNIKIRRVFIFSIKSGKVSNGEVLETIGFNYDVSSNLNDIISKRQELTIPGFSGVLLKYDINYFPKSNSVFKNGSKTSDIASIDIKKGNTKLLAKYKLEGDLNADYKVLTLNGDKLGYSLGEGALISRTSSGYSSTLDVGEGSGSGSGSGSGEESGDGSGDGSGEEDDDGGEYGGNPVIAVVIDTAADLCGYYDNILTGNARTGEITNLGANFLYYVNGIHITTYSAYIGVGCWVVTGAPNSALASTQFVERYNFCLAALALIIEETPFYTNAAAKAALVTELNIALSSFSSGPCSNTPTKPSTPAKYCN